MEKLAKFAINATFIIVLGSVALFSGKAKAERGVEKAVSVQCDFNDGSMAIYTFIESTYKDGSIGRFVVFERIQVTVSERDEVITITDEILGMREKNKPSNVTRINRKTGYAVESHNGKSVVGTCKKWVKPTTNKF